jgi:hypothetical protein
MFSTFIFAMTGKTRRREPAGLIFTIRYYNPERELMPTGRLKTWPANRGIGFIEYDSGGPDIFVHINALRVGGIDPNELKSS